MRARSFRWLSLLSIPGLLLLGSVALAARKAPSKTTSQVKRGEYLVRIAGCGDCHTPMVFNKEIGMPVPDMSRMLSGHPAGGPEPGGTLGPGDQAVIGPTFTAFRLSFGVVYSANLTPDKETGLGSWTEQDFIKTLRTGKHLGAGRQVLPPMPWMDFAGMTDEDLKAIFAYLRSVPAISNQVPPPKVDPKAIEEVGHQFDKLAAQMKAAQAAHGKKSSPSK